MARPAMRAWLLAPAGLAMLAGLDAGLLLAGLSAPVSGDRLREIHGVLMVLGFLATLISLERAVALRQPWGYVAPALLGAGGVALLTPAPLLLGQLLLVDGTIAMLVLYVALWRRQRDDPTSVQLLAVVMACCAAMLWVRVDVAAVLPWLTGFIVLTIAAERVELARLSLPATAGPTLISLAGCFVGAAMVALVEPRDGPGWGARGVGLLLLVIVAWLARNDVARRTIAAAGLPRFSGAAMLAGYGWLAVAGATWLVGGVPASQRGYDTVIHAVFLGFAVSMVFAHAPVILPAVLHRPLPYRRGLWAPLVLLHLGLLIRIGAGNGAGHQGAWQVGSALNVAAMLLFVIVAVAVTVRASASATATAPTGGTRRTVTRAATRERS